VFEQKYFLMSVLSVKCMFCAVDSHRYVAHTWEIQVYKIVIALLIGLVCDVSGKKYLKL